MQQLAIQRIAHEGIEAPNRLLNGSLEPGFKLDLMRKDVNLTLASARRLGVGDTMSSVFVCIFQSISETGPGRKDIAAPAQFHADSPGAKLNQMALL